MYTTSLKTWARAVGIDNILIGALVAGVIFHTPYALEVSVFFLWWVSVLGIVFGLLTLLMPAIFQKSVKVLEAKLELELYKGTEAGVKELTEKLEASKLALEKLEASKLVNRLAVSRTFLAYHWVTDIVVWSLLVIAGHPILATFRVASFLINCILIAKHRAHLHKTNP